MPRRDLSRELDRLARRSLGLVTRSELRSLGLSRFQIDRLVEASDLIAVRRAVYRLPGVGPSWQQCLLAAVLAAPAGSVASHRAAARHWQLRGLDAHQLEITVTRRCQLDAVRIHLSRHLPADDRHERGGVPITSPARTLCDVSGSVPDRILAQALDEALRRNQLTLRALERCARRLVVAGGPRQLGPILQLLRDRQSGSGVGDSPLEGRALEWLRRADLPDPVTQHRVPLANRSYRFDLAYPDLRIGIELLGWYEHGKRSAFEADLSRRNRFEIAGWLVLEFGQQHGYDEFIDTVRQARRRQLERLREISRLAHGSTAAGPAQDTPSGDLGEGSVRTGFHLDGVHESVTGGVQL